MAKTGKSFLKNLWKWFEEEEEEEEVLFFKSFEECQQGRANAFHSHPHRGQWHKRTTMATLREASATGFTSWPIILDWFLYYHPPLVPPPPPFSIKPSTFIYPTFTGRGQLNISKRPIPIKWLAVWCSHIYYLKRDREIFSVSFIFWKWLPWWEAQHGWYIFYADA